MNVSNKDNKKDPKRDTGKMFKVNKNPVNLFKKPLMQKNPIKIILPKKAENNNNNNIKVIHNNPAMPLKLMNGNPIVLKGVLVDKNKEASLIKDKNKELKNKETNLMKDPNKFRKTKEKFAIKNQIVINENIHNNPLKESFNKRRHLILKDPHGNFKAPVLLFPKINIKPEKEKEEFPPANKSIQLLKKPTLNAKNVSANNTNRPGTKSKLARPQSPHSSFPRQKPKLIKDIGFSLDQNKECRETMEDFIFTNLELTTDQNQKIQFLGLYDGFGGDTVVIQVHKSMHKILIKNLKHQKEKKVEELIIDSFIEMDEQLKTVENSLKCGTTATICFTLEEMLYIGNVGNSTAFLLENNSKVIKVSKDHDCKDQKEVERIKAKGGLVMQGRVFGSLSLTRCLGDFDFKENGVICRPSIYRTRLNIPESTIVIASDGVWDVITDKEMLDLIKKHISEDCKSLSKLIVKKSLELGTRDNVSCIVAKLG